MSKDLPLVGEQSRKTSESNIAYLGVDVAHGQKFDVAMLQINAFKDANIKAWFCDIVHTPNQTPYALHLKELIEAELKKQMGFKYREKDVVVCCNVVAARSFRARDKMYEIINGQRQQGKAENVNFKGPGGRTQEVEY